MTAPEEAVAVCFSVQVDKDDLGSFNSCEGLGCEFVIEQREEGGNNGMVWQLPTRIKYPNVKLTRPVTRDSQKITNWIAGMSAGIKRRTAIIEAKTLEGTTIASWSLSEVIPVRWTGPQLSAEQTKVATETLELAHHGFLDAR